MFATFEPVPGVIRVPLAAPFENFYCLIVPAPEHGEDFRQFYLMCRGFGVVVDMFTCSCDSDDDAADLAIRNAPDYIEPDKYY